jgi:hypothetical protein
MIRQKLWNSVAIVSIACIIWALLLNTSPVNDFYRYGYGTSGALCLMAFVANCTRRSVLANSLLVAGSIVYLIVPAKTFVRLLFSGEWMLLFQTFAAAFRAPNTQSYSDVQAATWFVDILIFQLVFAVYFIFLPWVIIIFSASPRVYQRVK